MSYPYKIIDKLDYEKIHALIVVNDWKWINHSTGKMEIPTIEQLKTTVSMLVGMAMNEKKLYSLVSTGGFVVIKYTNLEFKFTTLCVCFVWTHAQIDISDYMKY